MQRDNAFTRNSDDSFESDMGPPKPKFKEFSPLSSLDSIEMPVFHDLGSFLRHDLSHGSMITSFPVENSPKFYQNQSSFLDGANMLALQDVSGFLQPDSLVISRAYADATSRPGSPKPQVPAKNSPIVSARPPNITPNVNTPPPHRPYSFPASVTSCTSPPPQIIILPPLQAPAVPQSSASSESMYSMGTATDVSPHGGLFPFPLMPSSPPSQMLPLSASFLDLGPPKTSSFLDFDDPPPKPRTRDRLSPNDHV
ncbi:hypothetical protein BDZ94DRAFT_1020956 [Collybia nuda]|uniref:Uncharacterized protein n=1 Tax=Collybia nuda TaxID=64659 RepID=A0A9P5YEK8_9AGAR|nr:hypothetical protein BDZ94DRAFT_1020956 [Collybia nuda]